MQDEIYSKIDNIDDQIAQLFKERMLLSQQTPENGILKETRQRDALYRLSGACGPELENYSKILFGTLFNMANAYRHAASPDTSPLCRQILDSVSKTAFPTRASVACQGVEGAYSQQACDKLFPLPKITYYPQFEDVFQAVDRGECQYGVLPVENSSAGSVISVYDLMHKHNFYIVRSLRLKIDHCLLVNKGVKFEDVKEIISHEQALSQCNEYLKANPQFKVTVASNTAAAAEYVAKSGRTDLAAIASPVCAELYGLDIIADGFQNSDHNYTRFICISKNMEIYPDSSKITITATLPHKPGSLYELMAKFAARGLNLSKLESRPIPGKDFEFRFYFDIEAPATDNGTLSVLAQLEKDLHFSFLGGYLEKG